MIELISSLDFVNPTIDEALISSIVCVYVIYASFFKWDHPLGVAMDIVYRISAAAYISKLIATFPFRYLARVYENKKSIKAAKKRRARKIDQNNFLDKIIKKSNNYQTKFTNNRDKT